MSEQQQNAGPKPTQPKGRPVGGTEYSWCKAVPGGTGITVLALLLSTPPDLSTLQKALHKLEITHPILGSKLHFNPTANTIAYITPPSPHLQIQQFDLPSTTEILRNVTNPNTPSISTFHLILEHELNQNPWRDPDPSSPNGEIDVFFASVYDLSDGEWALMLRLHTGACDRVSAATLLRELVEVVGGEERESEERELEIGLEIEKCIPSGKANKPFWARGADMLGYSMNSLRLANLDFVDSVSPRSSQFVTLQMSSDETDRILSACKARAIGLCGVLAAAGLIAARSSKCLPDDQWEKYAVVTLIDCRPFLDPVISSHDIGFYHSAILNTHDVNGGEKFWELANRTYTAFTNAKKGNKHFSDMADLNFLMCKAIDNPGLTPSSSLRTSLISVFEDPVINHSSEMHKAIGVKDYVGCASVHGVGPSLAIFDTIRDGRLDCPCVYPAPLHSREQMQGLVDGMKRVLVDACSCLESES